MKLVKRKEHFLSDIRPDNYTLTHLLGYLKPEQWADGLSAEYRLNKDLVVQLLEIQDKTYKSDITGEVKELIKDG